jgi:DNA-nicking Smr family endonuclease
MARKKPSPGKPQRAKEFVNSPFRGLKGLAGSGRAQPDGPPVQEPRNNPGTSQPAPDDLQSFADEMQFLGVKQLAGRSAPASQKGQPAAAADTNPDSREEHDRDLFLEALGEMTHAFQDDVPELETQSKAAPRRLRQVARGQLKPEAELDLHGLTVDEALTRVRFFLDDARYRGLQTVLIITGKGLHSPDGPVLRQAVEKLLDQSRQRVLEWGNAPRSYGGGGALVVFPRCRAGQ